MRKRRVKVVKPQATMPIAFRKDVSDKATLSVLKTIRPQKSYRLYWAEEDGTCYWAGEDETVYHTREGADTALRYNQIMSEMQAQIGELHTELAEIKLELAELNGVWPNDQDQLEPVND